MTLRISNIIFESSKNLTHLQMVFGAHDGTFQIHTFVISTFNRECHPNSVEYKSKVTINFCLLTGSVETSE